MKQNYLPHLVTRVFGVPLLIEEHKLAVILEAIGPRLGLREPILIEGIAGINPGTVVVVDDDDEDEEEMAAPSGRKPYPVTPEGIAIIGISGTLVKKASWLDSESGLQSYQTLRRHVADSRDDPAIKGILLDVDSPGGEVGGLFDLADEVHTARAAKPVYAVANDEAYSAAYALASSAEKVFVTRTGGVGSIGVIAIHMDQSGFDEKIGRKYTAIFSGARKNDFSTHQPLSDVAYASLKAEIDRLAGMFHGTVNKNRGLTPAAIRNMEASLYFGEWAVEAGLADRVGTFEDALAAVTEAARASKQVRATASAEAQIPEREDPMSQTTDPKPADAPAAPVAPSAETTKPAETPAAAPASAAAPPAAPVPAVPPAAPVAAVDTAAIEARIQAANEAKIALCKTAGRLDMLPEMLSPSLTVAQVSERLVAAGAQKSAASQVNSQVNAAPTGAESQLHAAATQIAAAKHISYAQAYTEALKLNPGLYNQYLAEKSAGTVARPN